MARKGFAIRMMEPGEAQALRSVFLSARSSHPHSPPRPGAVAGAFVRWLVSHEIFVAAASDGRVAGFAAARDVEDLYWLSDLSVAPDWQGRGVRTALLRAVEARAGWFFHRAVGLALPPGSGKEDWYRRRRFIGIPEGDWTASLAAVAREEPGVPGAEAGGNPDAAPSSLQKTVMVHWL